MVWAFISTILDGIATISRKKSLELNGVLSSYGFKILGMFGPLIFLPYYIFTQQYNIENYSLSIIGMIILICFARTQSTNIAQIIYKSEKISLLMPFENLNKVGTIIISFFLLQDGNISTVIVSFVVIFILLLSSIDFKSIRLPRVFGLIFIQQFLITFRSITTAYLIIKIGGFTDYFIIESTILMLFLLVGTIIYSDGKKFFKLGKEFYLYRIIAGVVGTFSYVIGLYLISSVGLILTILLSFLGIFIKILLGYMILGEKAAKKDILLAIMICLLVGVGFILNQ